MENSLFSTIFYLLISLPIFVFVFVMIGKTIYQNSKRIKNVSRLETIFSWAFFAFYAITFFATIVFMSFGNVKWSLICFGTIVASIVLPLLIGGISNAIKKHKSKKTKTRGNLGGVVTNRVTMLNSESIVDNDGTELVLGKLVGAYLQAPSLKEIIGREPINTSYYSLVFEYEENGGIDICSTKNGYTLSEIAYINKYYKTSYIKVNKSYCEININVTSAPKSYDLKDIEDLKISN